MADTRTVGKRQILNALGQIENLIGDIREMLDNRGEIKPASHPIDHPPDIWDCPAPTDPDK